MIPRRRCSAYGTLMIIDVWPNGELQWGGQTGRRVRCALGPAGIVEKKAEGDGATPAGTYPLRRVLFRPDRMAPPATALPTVALKPTDGWCDDPADPQYNRPVQLPYPASCESLWRNDHVYDLIVVLGHNDSPPRPGLGSAVFFHLARPDFAPTEGCVAIGRANMIEILSKIDKSSSIVIHSSLQDG